MSTAPPDPLEGPKDLSALERALQDQLKGQPLGKFGRFVLAAMGSIPWVGGVIAGLAGLHAEAKQSKTNSLHRLWLEEHKLKLEQLASALTQIIIRLQGQTDEVQKRFESPEYLELVRKAFRIWDEADTHEKRELVCTLLTNACATALCPDDLVRLFLDWIRTYHEAHFKVIREIYSDPGITRGEIWDRIGGQRPRENSADADLFKLLVRDLSTGGVIRQHRDTDGDGNFLRRPPSGGSRARSRVAKSAFDDSDAYVLTELGKEFVHYTMNAIVPRLEATDPSKKEDL